MNVVSSLRALGRAALAGLVGVAAATMLTVPGPRPVAAASARHEVSASVALAPSNTEVVLPRFDPTAGVLRAVAVTLDVAGATVAQVTNLSEAMRSATVSADTRVSATGPAGTALTAAATASASRDITSGGTARFDLDGAGTAAQTIAAANDVAAFAGSGTVTFELVGGVAIDLTGAAATRHEGNTAITATVTLVYDYDAASIAAPDTATVLEDSAATAIDVLANDGDPDGGPLTIVAAEQPADGTTAITHDGRALTYTPDPDYCGTDTFTYTLTGGSTATVSVSVTCVNDAPVLQTPSQSATYTENDPATPVAAGISVTDVDDTALASATVTISDGLEPGDALDHTSHDGIDGVYDSGAGVLTLTGAAPLAAYESVLRSVAFSSTSNNPPSAKSIEFVVHDGDDASAPVSITVTIIPVDDAPVAVDDDATVTEDDPATALDVLVNDSDPDGDPLAIDSVTQPANGSVVITGGGTGLTYEPDADYCGTDTFTYTLLNGPTATVTVTVTCVDDPPSPTDDDVTTDEDTPVTFNVLDNDADPDGGPVSVTVQVGPASGTVEPALETGEFTYIPNPDFCGVDGFSYRVNGVRTGSVTITVECVDDPPVAQPDAATVAEDAAATTIDVLANDTDPDGPVAVGSVTQPANGTVAITGGGTGLTYQPDPDYCNAPPGTALDLFTYTLVDGPTATVSVTVTCVNDAPIAADETFTGAIGNTTFVVNASGDGAPAVADPTDTSPAASRPHQLVSANLLDGATDVDGDALNVVAGTISTSAGGTVSIEADGDFVYEPPAGCTTAVDTFDYVVTDGGSPELTGAGTVTIEITGCVWYVNNDDAEGDSGTAAEPFDTIAEAVAAAQAGHVIFVYAGDGTTTGYDQGVALQDDQQLIGEASALVVGGHTLHAGNPARRPTLSALDTDVIELASRNTVRGLGVDPDGDVTGIAGGSGVDGGTIADVRIVDAAPYSTQPGLELDGTAGVFDVSDLVVATDGAYGVRLVDAGVVNFADSGMNTITTRGSAALHATRTSFGTSTIDDIVVTESPDGGVMLFGTSGDLRLGDGQGIDLSLATIDSGNSIRHEGSITVDPDGIDSVTSVGDVALTIFRLDGGAIALDELHSSGGSSGVFISDFFGSLSVASGEVSGASSYGLMVQRGSGDIAFGADINDGPGDAVFIEDRAGGTTTVSGTITDGSDERGGILIIGSSGTTIFSGPDNTIDTGGFLAVRAASSPDHRLVFSGGGLAITTTSGPAIHVNGGGQVEVTGTGNTIATTTARAVHLDGTDIGPAGLTFERISVDGAPSGIELTSTGNQGGLVVTGAGGPCTSAVTCSGGAILNTTGPGIRLTDTEDVDLTRMYIGNSGTHAVDGTGLADPSADEHPSFGFHDGVIEGTGADGSGLYFASAATNLTGQLIVERTAFRNVAGDAVHVVNDGGVLDVDVTEIHVEITDAALSGGGVSVTGTGAALVSVDVMGSRFDSIERAAIALVAENNTTFDANVASNVSTGARGVGDTPVISLIAEGAGAALTFDVVDNTVVGSDDSAIYVGEEGTLTGRINNNTVADAKGSGIIVDTGDASTTTSRIEITNNLLGAEYEFESVPYSQLGGFGVAIFHSEGPKTLHLVVVGNTIMNSGSTAIGYVSYNASGGAGPEGLVKIENNAFGNNVVAYAVDFWVQHAGNNACTAIRNNPTLPSLRLSRADGASLSVVQQDPLEIHRDNGDDLDIYLAITGFSVPCVPLAPDNP